MPWKECHVVDERLRFVGRLLDGEPMAGLCEEFGISRKTGYKIYARYKDCGLVGLTDRSRRPYRYANRLPMALEKWIVRLKREYPDWGAPPVALSSPAPDRYETDATGRSIHRSATLEASSLGAAVCAAVGAGIYGTAIEAAVAMSGQALRETNPSPDNRAVYADLLGIYREVYPSLRQTFAKLARRATTCASLPGSMSP
jgi:hypothetical protein